MARIRPVSHQDRLTLIEHLDELRTRIIISIVAFVVAFSVCAWQNHAILEILNDPLPGDIKPITFGVTEPFMTTITVSAYAGLLVALPVILYQLYSFVLPAFSPQERRIALPLLLMVPFLFIAGVVFCYFVVLEPAMKFLLSFNSDQFNIQVRARDYYSFITMIMLAMGLAFQVPVGVLAACKLGLTNVQKLRKGRRYAVVVIVILAALLPTVDPVSLLLESIPMYLLYELSILLAAAWGRPLSEMGEQPATEGSG